MRLLVGMIAAAIFALTPGCGNNQDTGLIPSLEQLAEAGNAEAIYYLGMAYQTGSGVAEDHARALAAFRKAAALGNPLASYKLGCYYDGQGAGLVAQDVNLALKYKLIAAEAGYALAQQDVAALYVRNGNVPAALVWIKKSADQGWLGGLFALAWVYNGADGVEPDAAKTAAYFQLFLARTEASSQQIDWLENIKKQLSSDQKKQADEIIRSYRPAPTQLTDLALSGERAARALVAEVAKE